MSEPAPITREEFLAHITPIQHDVSEIVKLLREQGADVTDLKVRLAVQEAIQPGRKAAQWGAGSGAAVATVLIALKFLTDVLGK